MEVFRLMGSILINRGEVTGDLKGIEREARTLGDRMGATFTSIGNKMHTALKVGAVAAGTAVVGIGVAAVKAFGEFDDAMRRVYTLLPRLDDMIRKDLTEGVMELSEEFGVLPEKIIPALYRAIQAGIPPENVFDFMREAGHLAIGTVSDLSASVDALTSVVNAYGEDTITATQAADIMFTAVRIGKTTVDELGGSMHATLPIAATLGIRFEEVAAWAARLTLTGTPAKAAMTKIRAALAEVAREGSAAADVFEKAAGETFPAFIARGGSVADAFDLMAKYAAANGIEVTEMMGGLAGLQAVLGITGDHIGGFRDALDEMAGSAGAAKGAFDEMEAGMSDAVEDLQAWWGRTLIEIGRELEAPFRDFLAWLEGNTPKITELLGDVFGAVSGGMKWVLDNHQAVARGLGVISAAFLVLWAKAHPVAAALTAIGVGLALLTRAGAEAEKEFDAIVRSFEDSTDALNALHEGLAQLTRNFALNADQAAKLRDGFAHAWRTAMDLALAGRDVTEVTEMWRQETGKVLDAFVKTYPELTDLVNKYREAFVAGVGEQLDLIEQRRGARDAEAAAEWEQHLADVAAAEKARELDAEEMKRLAREREARERVFLAQRDQLHELDRLAVEHANTLRVAAEGSEEWLKATAGLNHVLGQAEQAINALHPENAYFVEGLETLIASLRTAGATGATATEQMEALRGEFLLVRDQLDGLELGTQEHADLLAGLPGLYLRVQQAMAAMRAEGREVPGELNAMAEVLREDVPDALNVLAEALDNAERMQLAEIEKELDRVERAVRDWVPLADEFSIAWAQVTEFIKGATEGLADSILGLYHTWVSLMADNEEAAREHAEAIEEINLEHAEALADARTEHDAAMREIDSQYVESKVAAENTLAATLKQIHAQHVEARLAAEERYAATAEGIHANYVNAKLAADARYEEAKLSATERFIKQVQREGETVEEREAMIAEAVARGLLTQEEANAARARMTDAAIEHESSAIFALEQALKDAEAAKLRAVQEAEEEKIRATEEAEAARAEAIRQAEAQKVEAIAQAEAEKVRAVQEAEAKKLEAIRRAEAEKVAAIQKADENKARSTEDAAERRSAAEKDVFREIMRGIAAALRGMAQQAAAMAAAELVMAGILAAAAAALFWLPAVAAALGGQAKAALANFAAYTAKAGALLGAATAMGGLAGLAEGGLVQRPTLAVVGEGQHEEAVLPLTETVFRRLGTGIVAAMGHVRYPDMAVWPEYRPEDRVVETVNFERMFDGATINVRDRGDVEDLAVEIHRLFVDRQRGVGVVGVIR